MNVYNQEELDRIARIRDTNDKLEDFFKNKRQGFIFSMYLFNYIWFFVS